MKRSAVIAVFLSIIILCLCVPTQATVRYVKHDSPTDGPGTGWANAYHTITQAMNVAVSGDQIWVAEGTYLENVIMKMGIQLYGGYSGDMAIRDPKLYPTIIDGKQAGSVIFTPSSNLNVTIDGFTIRNGKAANGGGIYCQGITTISNNIICDNTAQATSSSNGFGGGIYCRGASAVISGNIVERNAAFGRGGGGSGTGGVGGGIYCAGGGSPTISNNTIRLNNAMGWQDASGRMGDYGSAIYNSYTTTSIAGNLVYDNGGQFAIFTYGGSATTIKGNVVCGNGAGILIGCSSVTVTSNTVADNESDGIYCTINGTAYLYNNIVAFNGNVGVNNLSGIGSLTKNDVYGNLVNYSGIGAGATDISLDPRFFDSASRDYHLKGTSPCRDAGDNAKVTGITSDIDGEARIFPASGSVDIGADEYNYRAVSSVAEIKVMEDGELVAFRFDKPIVATVKLTNLGAYYAQSYLGGCGVQCRGATLLSPSWAAPLKGEMDTIDGERVLINASFDRMYSYSLQKPFSMNSTTLGGSALGLQGGIEGAVGVNNIGLLVTVYGQVTQIAQDGSYFYIDDGCGLLDGTSTDGVANVGVRIAADGRNLTNSYVSVKGASSCFKDAGEKLRRLVRPQSLLDVQVIQQPLSQ